MCTHGEDESSINKFIFSARFLVVAGSCSVAKIPRNPTKMAEHDYLRLISNPKVLKVLESKGHNFPSKEVLLFSSVVTKINRKGKEQARVMVITDKAM